MGFRLPFFGRSKPSRYTIEEQLAARPVHAVDATMDAQEDGGGKLRVRLKPAKLNRWFLRLPEGSTKTFEFDPIGRMVWESCDGKTSVQQIIRKLSKRYNLRAREAQVSTTMFLNTLTRKGLIAMIMKGDKPPEK
jgi:hypothetical protein